MKRIISILIAALFILAALPAGARDSKTRDLPEVPVSIADMTEIGIDEIPRPTRQYVGAQSFMCCIPTSGTPITRIAGNGRILLMVGQYYYKNGLIKPYEMGDTAVCAKNEADRFIIYAEAEGGSGNIEVQPPVMEGNAQAVILTEQIGPRTVDIVIPQEYAEETFDFESAVDAASGYLAAQDGQPFHYLGGLTEIRYYRYGESIYSRVILTERNKEIVVEAPLLFDPAYEWFYAYNSHVTMTYAYEGDDHAQYFHFAATGMNYIDSSFEKRYGCVYYLGTTGLRQFHSHGAPIIELYPLAEGIILVRVFHVRNTPILRERL